MRPEVIFERRVVLRRWPAPDYRAQHPLRVSRRHAASAAPWRYRTTTDHHVIDDGLALVPVKTLRSAPTTPHGVAAALTGSSTEPAAGSYVMVRAPVARKRSADHCIPRPRKDDIIDREAESEEMSLARCRELLGDEGAELSDEQLEAIRQHAQAMAVVLAELFLTKHSQS